MGPTILRNVFCQTLFLSMSLCLVFPTKSIHAQVEDSSPRNTPLVKVIRQIEPSVAALFYAQGNQIMSGSGMIIHRDGYILTNHHVLLRGEGVALIGNRKPIPFRVVARLPESDFAIVKLTQVPPDLQPLPLGRSGDLMNGETVVVAGNPGGRGIVFTSGIVSAKDVLEGGPNALVMTNYENSKRDRFIQFDAASNRGNSGGPLVNMEGQVIGIVSAMVLQEQNVGLAIPIDRVRSQFERMLESEAMHQSQIGLSLDPLAQGGVVAKVQAGSPAALAGVQVGDRLLTLDDSPITSAIDWALHQDACLAKGATMQVKFSHQKETKSVSIKPEAFNSMQPVEVTKPQAGLKVEMYDGKFNALPDFSKLKPFHETVCKDLKNLQAVTGERQDFFALVMHGHLRIDEDGLYRLIILSDDGSKLRLGEDWIIDNDGNHPPKAVGRLVRLKQGYHPIRIEYFQGNGDKRLQLLYERVITQATIGIESPKEFEADRFVHAEP